MNKNDSERIVSLLLGIGLEETAKENEADLSIINTCSVRQSAEDRVFGFVTKWQKYREHKPNLIIAITGCMPGRNQNGQLRKKIKGVDLFFPTQELPLLPKRLKELNLDLFEGSFENLENYLQINPCYETKHKASITIQTGCNNFCTYCVVPYARGREYNRPLQEILAEIKLAAQNGCKEVSLLGQVVNNYKLQASDSKFLNDKNPFVMSNLASRGEKTPIMKIPRHPDVRRDSLGMTMKDDFVALLWEVNQIAGIERINFIAADPQYFNDNQITALTLPKMMNYLHLPAQSGDNEILRKMNRKYTREYYLDLVKKIRVARPAIALGTDIIVGFCGETEAQFQNTLDLFKQCDFDISFHAKYSERDGTVAAKAFKDDVPHAEKKRRWEILQDYMEANTFRKNQRYAGKIISVLVDTCENGVCSGNSSEIKLVQFLGGPELIGQIVPIKITQALAWVLRGKIEE